MIDAWLNEIAKLISNHFWIAPILALLAGVLTSFTPCSLSNVPLIIGYVGGMKEKNAKNGFKYSVIFSLGTAITFVALGVIATSAGRMLGTSSSLWYLILGVLMVLMALQTWDVYQFIPSMNLIAKSKVKGAVGAFLAGILGGIFASPCSTPVLIALLSIVAGKGNFLWGILLMFLYSLGHSFLVIIAGTSMTFVKKISGSEGYNRLGTVLKVVMGSGILLIGFYMFWLAF